MNFDDFRADLLASAASRADALGMGWREGFVVEALERSQAVIEFTPQGEILRANENFLKTLGYELSEIVGRHHSMFVPEQDRASEAYAAFWADLSRLNPMLYIINAFRYGILGISDVPVGMAFAMVTVARKIW